MNAEEAWNDIQKHCIGYVRGDSSHGGNPERGITIIKQAIDSAVVGKDREILKWKTACAHADQKRCDESAKVERERIVLEYIDTELASARTLFDKASDEGERLYYNGMIHACEALKHDILDT